MHSALLSCIVVLALSDVVDGWSGDAHEHITRVALSVIGKDRATRRYLHDHLGDTEAIVVSSVWADSDEAETRYPKSNELHFSHTPLRHCGDFVMSRDCGFRGSGQCIVTGIADMIIQATNPEATLRDRADALKFVIHLIGDIHQPLHTGFAEDFGGVAIDLSRAEPAMNLHQLWDYGILVKLGFDHFSPPVHDNTEIFAPDSVDYRDALIEYASRLASESSNSFTCKFAYQNEAGLYIENGDEISDEYHRSRHAIIGDRLGIAGQRLAKLLTAMAQHFASRFDAPTVIAPPVNSVEDISEGASPNRFAVLDIEFEPDDILEEEWSESPIVSDTVSPKSKPKKRVRKIDEFPSADPVLVGAIDIRNVVMKKMRGVYLLTCRELVQENPNYEPIHVAHYLVQFSRNRKRKDPVRFVIDFRCFRKPVNSDDFLKILNYLSRGDTQSEAVVPVGFSASVSRATVADVVDISRVTGEYTDEAFKNRTSRAWHHQYQRNPEVLAGIVAFLRTNRLEYHAERYFESQARNQPYSDMMDLEFFSKFRDLLVMRFEDSKFIVHRQTLLDTNRTAMSFLYAPCTDRDVEIATRLGRSILFKVFIDTNIFDGFITPRIIQGINSLTRRAVNGPIPEAYARPTWVSEMEDVDSLINGSSAGRANRFKAIKAYYIYPSAVSQLIGHIEWTIDPHHSPFPLSTRSL